MIFEPQGGCATRYIHIHIHKDPRNEQLWLSNILRRMCNRTANCRAQDFVANLSNHPKAPPMSVDRRPQRKTYLYFTTSSFHPARHPHNISEKRVQKTGSLLTSVMSGMRSGISRWIATDPLFDLR